MWSLWLRNHSKYGCEVIKNSAGGYFSTVTEMNGGETVYLLPQNNIILTYSHPFQPCGLKTT